MPCLHNFFIVFQFLLLYGLLQKTKHKKVKLCLDSDEKGQLAVKRISNGLTIKGIEHEFLVPIHKDWNEDLLLGKEIEEQEDETCQALQQ